MQEVWQTTNQQPWVYALSHGVISLKTRTSYPVVPVGAIVLLHSSKSRMWPGWKNLSWTKDLYKEDFVCGAIEAVGVVSVVGRTDNIIRLNEKKYWDVFTDGTCWNCAADYAVRFSKVIRLSIPVPTRGFQAPFVHAKAPTVRRVLDNNPNNKELHNLFNQTCIMARATRNSYENPSNAKTNYFSC